MVKAYTSIQIAPIGAVIAWLKSYTNTPQTLPIGWVECDGSTLSDLDSVYNGQVIPDLNGNNNFLRGNSTSGGTGGSSTHTLSITEMPSHDHPLTPSGSPATYWFPWAEGSTNNWAGLGTSNAQMTTWQRTGFTGGGGAHENKPPFYNVVWIMRIK